ncbi:MAG: hypothetical protein K2N58_02050 [Treponemataceae bacterium]|nr:hypothetical protein [Treponemataceae bacterium]MDE7290807.1 hypothetical protein [Treponemataceae bacterium]
MVLKLILTILIIVLISFFTGFNLQNVCNIWLFGKTFSNVPVFITALISFAAGILATLLAVFFTPKKKITSEQARAEAERLEQKEKKNLERQQKIQKKIEQAKARVAKSDEKKSGKNSSSNENLGEQNSASENSSEKK